MIEISLGKMVLLALIALIVLGPEKLPGAARTAGALLRRVRSGWDNVRAEVERELEIEEIKRSAREAVAGAEAAQQQVKDTLKQAHDPFAEAAAMVRLQPASANTLAPPAERPPDSGVVDAAQRDLLQPGGGVPAHRDAGAVASDRSHQSDPSVHGTHASEPDDAVQAELPLEAPALTGKDGPHGNA